MPTIHVDVCYRTAVYRVADFEMESLFEKEHSIKSNILHSSSGGTVRWRQMEGERVGHGVKRGGARGVARGGVRGEEE